MLCTQHESQAMAPILRNSAVRCAQYAQRYGKQLAQEVKPAYYSSSSNASQLLTKIRSGISQGLKKSVLSKKQPIKRTPAALLGLGAAALFTTAYLHSDYGSNVNAEEIERPLTHTATLLSKVGFDFFSWKSKCEQLLKNNAETAVPKPELENIINHFLDVHKKQLYNTNKWLHNNKVIDTIGSGFAPYVERVNFPAGSTVAFHGDLHGNVQAVNNFLASLADRGYMAKDNPFRIQDKNFRLVFLGDYTDRGKWGIETIYTVLRLKIENPDQVFMVRGNHEDVDINAHYGFAKELSQKYGSDAKNIMNKMNYVYNALPVALFAGVGQESNKEYILCCHGGWEVGYDPSSLLNASKNISYHAFKELERKTIFDRLPKNIQIAISNVVPTEEYQKNIVVEKPTYPVNCGFMWNDFIPDEGINAVDYKRGRGWLLGKPLVDALRATEKNKAQVKGIFRAHQHGDLTLMKMMEKDGVAKLWQSATNKANNALWDGIVCTFLVAPDTGYGNTFDAWGELHIAESFSKCQLIMHNDK